MVFDHVEIHVSDLAASRAFYGEALGLPTVDATASPGHGRSTPRRPTARSCSTRMVSC